jgi:hypothetical protein
MQRSGIGKTVPGFPLSWAPLYSAEGLQVKEFYIVVLWVTTAFYFCIYPEAGSSSFLRNAGKYLARCHNTDDRNLKLRHLRYFLSHKGIFS